MILPRATDSPDSTASDSHRTLTAPNTTPPKTVAIHQPNYFPNPTFFRKLARSDLFIILDDVQYRRRGYINRNRIKTAHGVRWLTIPMLVKGRYHARINELSPNWSENWRRTHLRTIEHSYKRARFFDEVYAEVVQAGLGSDDDEKPGLVEINVRIIRAICHYLGIRITMRHSSEYGVRARAGARLAELVRQVGGTRYLSGVSGRRYIDPDVFRASGIGLSYVESIQRVYPQLWGAFQPGLSILDMLFNCGRESLSFIVGNDTMESSNWQNPCPAS